MFQTVILRKLTLSGAGLALAAMLPLGHVALGKGDARAAGQPAPAASEGMPQVAPAATTNVSEADLKKFAKASQALHSLQTEHQQALAGVQDQSKATEMQQKFQTKMLQAVQTAGLSPERFNEIGQALNSDPALQDRLRNVMGG